MRSARSRHPALCLLPVILSGVFGAGCATTTTPASTSIFAVTGTVYRSPACGGPVRIDSPCPDQPLNAATVVATQGTTTVATTRTDPAGHYRITLPRGTYQITATNTGGYRSQTSKTVELPPDTVIDLTVDSGMR
jgi:hypothetical protein